MWGPKQEKVQKPQVLRLYCWISSMWVSEEDHSVRDGVQTCSSSEISRTRTIYSTETHTSDFILNTFRNGKPVQFSRRGVEWWWQGAKSCEGQSQDSVHRPQFLKRKESRSRFKPRSLCLPAYNALPLGQTSSLTRMMPGVHIAYAMPNHDKTQIVWIKTECCSDLPLWKIRMICGQRWDPF